MTLVPGGVSPPRLPSLGPRQPRWEMGDRLRQAAARAWPRKLVARAIAALKKGYNRLKKRYGPRYTKALLLVVFLAFFSPVPGTTLVAVAAIMATAEVHRAVARRRLYRGHLMFTPCAIILPWGAT